MEPRQFRCFRTRRAAASARTPFPCTRAARAARGRSQPALARLSSRAAHSPNPTVRSEIMTHFFRCKSNPNGPLLELEAWEAREMENHPDYEEVDHLGEVIVLEDELQG